MGKPPFPKRPPVPHEGDPKAVREARGVAMATIRSLCGPFRRTQAGVKGSSSSPRR